MISKLRRLPGQIYGKLKYELQDPWHMLQRMRQSYWHARDLELVQDKLAAASDKGIYLFATLRNEAVRIPYFLDYYRRLGVDHFYLVDNGSTDHFMEVVRDQPDVSVWFTLASYKQSNFGMHWLNHLLRKYGSGHWCVTCDPDEFLVFPHSEDRDLCELAAFLESENRLSLCCLMLDMYADLPIEKTEYVEGEDPRTVAPYFDSTGYIEESGWLKENYTRGGVRRRMFFRDIPDQSPALNKTPFVKWRPSYSYFLSMHQVVPSLLNKPHAEFHDSPTGCVLHFKYFSLLTQKVHEELDRKEHWDDSFEYRRYNEQLEAGSVSLLYEGSAKYEGWKNLVELGLMNQGRWF